MFADCIALNDLATSAFENQKDLFGEIQTYANMHTYTQKPQVPFYTSLGPHCLGFQTLDSEDLHVLLLSISDNN